MVPRQGRSHSSGPISQSEILRLNGRLTQVIGDEFEHWRLTPAEKECSAADQGAIDAGNYRHPPRQGKIGASASNRYLHQGRGREPLRIICLFYRGPAATRGAEQVFVKRQFKRACDRFMQL
jgi:hypothetical protein